MNNKIVKGVLFVCIITSIFACNTKKEEPAIADGATEGWQSGGWAKHLAGAYIERPPGPADIAEWLADVRISWQPAQAPTQSWYAEVKAEQGSFATLLGIEFRLATDPPGLVWKAVAIGDSCLFLVRDGAIEVAFPVGRAEEFGNQPPLVPSSTDRTCPDAEWLAGWSEPGDLFVMVTDAVAKLILESGDGGSHPLIRAADRAIDTDTTTPVLELLNVLRPRLNDDATLMAVKVAHRRSTR